MLVSTGLFVEFQYTTELFRRIHPFHLAPPYQILVFYGNNPSFSIPYIYCRASPDFILKRHWLYHLLIQILASIFLSIRLFQSPERYSYTCYNINSLLMAVIFLGIGSSSFLHYINRNSFPLFINQLLVFESKNFPASILKLLSAKICPASIRIIRLIFLLECFVTPICTLVFPSYPWNTFPFQISSQIHIIPFVALHTISVLWNYLCYSSLMSVSTTTTLICLIISNFGLNSSLKVFQNRLMISPYSAFTTTYRQIQLLCSLYNYNHQKTILPLTILLWLVALICSGHTSIIQLQSADLSFCPLLSFIATFVLSTLSLFICLGYFAQVFLHSNKILFKSKYGKTTRFYSKRDKRVIKRLQLSCPPIRISIFGQNFIEARTPLIIIDFGIEQVASLVLMNWIERTEDLSILTLLLINSRLKILLKYNVIRL